MAETRKPEDTGSGRNSEDLMDHTKNVVLKFGRRGTPHEVSIHFSKDFRFLQYRSKKMGPYFGKLRKIEVKKINRMMLGQNTPPFQRYNQTYGPQRTQSFSVMYSDHGTERSLDLLVRETTDFDATFNGISRIVDRNAAKREQMTPDMRFLTDMWELGDKDGDNNLIESEIISLVANMNINMNSDVVSKMFKQFDKDNSGTMDFNEFTEFIELLKDRPILKSVWGMIIRGETISENFDLDKVDADITKECITLEKFCEFMKKVQLTTMSPREAISFINDRSTIKVDANKPEVTYGMFFNVMTYEDNDIIDSSKAVKNHDMTHPLAHYFIASSHNTYLEGDQLTSNSSVNRYIDDLISGCRCVELDCWDGDAGEPIIYHGHTLTSQIFFKDVIVAIKEYGFKSSPYPIILSIEQHCSLEQQARQVEIMKSTFGDMLGMPQEGRSALPSPEDLKYKVLLKGNRNKAIGRDDDDENSDVEEKKKASTDKTHPELSAITFLGTSKVKEFNDSGNSHIPCDSMCSFSETTTLKYLKSETTTENWVKHNNIHMSRIYPMGTRVDSSNYDPVPCWTAGNHLVALNYQTPDRPMQLNRGKFRENGNCGYLLKPSYMLEAGAKSPPIQLTITILSAHQLPRPALSTKIGIIDPFISVAVFNDMEEMQEQRTKTMYNNGFNPLYNETKTFTVKNPDLAILAFQVIDEEEVIRTQSFCAMACLGVSCVKPGLREVKLFDGNGGRNTDFAHATVTVYVQVQPLAG